jgi:hypothetical protein
MNKFLLKQNKIRGNAAAAAANVHPPARFRNWKMNFLKFSSVCINFLHFSKFKSSQKRNK